MEDLGIKTQIYARQYNYLWRTKPIFMAEMTKTTAMHMEVLLVLMGFPVLCSVLSCMPCLYQLVFSRSLVLTYDKKKRTKWSLGGAEKCLRTTVIPLMCLEGHLSIISFTIFFLLLCFVLLFEISADNIIDLEE